MEYSTTTVAQDPGQQHLRALTESRNFKILTSFRLDVSPDSTGAISKLHDEDQPFPFSLHRDRLADSAEAFGWRSVAVWLSGPTGTQFLLNRIASGISSKPISVATSFKVRLTISRDGEVEFDYAELPLTSSMDLPQALFLDSCLPQRCKVLLDYEPTEPSLLTRHKTTARVSYDAARERVGVTKVTADAGEVLLFNHESRIMEASLSTPYFLREGRWVTPPLSSGGNDGVTRRVALAKHLCVEEEVHVKSLRHGEVVWISNGVRGFILGFLHLHN